VHARLRIDISRLDLLAALGAALLARDRPRLARELEESWSPEGDGVVCLSVRSGFDLLLAELDLPVGSEALVSAVTIPDMAHVLEAHDVTAVPVDLDPETLAPLMNALHRGLTPRTRLLIVAHLFGGRVNLEPLASFSAEHGLLLIEDAAQALRGPDDRGDLRAGVSMFSFGPIKTATALGGALLRVSDPTLRAAMRRRQASLPVQPRREHATRALLFLALSLLQSPRAYGVFARACRAAGRDLDGVLGGLVQPFPNPPEPGTTNLRGALVSPFVADIRRQPSAPLLSLLARRLRRFDHSRLSRRAQAGERVRRGLPTGLELPGARAQEHTHWLVPIVGAEPNGLVRTLRAAGLDATRAATSMVALPAPEGRPSPRNASRMMDGIVFVPAYPEVGEAGLSTLGGALWHAGARDMARES